MVCEGPRLVRGVGCSDAGSVVSWKEPWTRSQGFGVPASALTITITVCSPYLSKPHFSLLVSVKDNIFCVSVGVSTPPSTRVPLSLPPWLGMQAKLRGGLFTSKSISIIHTRDDSFKKYKQTNVPFSGENH